MANILVVDDDETSRKAICAVLASANYAVTEAIDGKVAQDLMQSNLYDLVIADIVMPQIDGLELLNWIKEKYSTPVILITGNSNILEAQKAHELGAQEFVTKPVSYSELLKIIESVLTRSIDHAEPAKSKSDELTTPAAPAVNDEEMASKDFAYCRLPIDDFSRDDALELNIYVRLSAEKYLRVAHKGDFLPPDRVENYRRKGVEYLYARKDDIALLVNFAADFSKIIQRSTTSSVERRTEFLRYTNELLMDRLFIDGFDKVIFEQACRNLQLCLSVISESESLINLLQALNEHSDWIYAHSLGVGVCSTMISKKMGWHSMASLFKVGAGAIFHDVGKKEIDSELLSKSRPLLTLEERRRIDFHPSLSREILATTNALPEEIVKIVYEHHESCNGMGYPKQLKKDQIHPMARVIAVADRFCNYAIPNPHSTGANADNALKLVQENYADQLDPIPVSALKMLCARA